MPLVSSYTANTAYNWLYFGGYAGTKETKMPIRFYGNDPNTATNYGSAIFIITEW